MAAVLENANGNRASEAPLSADAGAKTSISSAINTAQERREIAHERVEERQARLDDMIHARMAEERAAASSVLSMKPSVNEESSRQLRSVINQEIVEEKLRKEASALTEKIIAETEKEITRALTNPGEEHADASKEFQQAVDDLYDLLSEDLDTHRAQILDELAQYLSDSSKQDGVSNEFRRRALKSSQSMREDLVNVPQLLDDEKRRANLLAFADDKIYLARQAHELATPDDDRESLERRSVRAGKILFDYLALNPQDATARALYVEALTLNQRVPSAKFKDYCWETLRQLEQDKTFAALATDERYQRAERFIIDKELTQLRGVAGQRKDPITQDAFARGAAAVASLELDAGKKESARVLLSEAERAVCGDLGLRIVARSLAQAGEQDRAVQLLRRMKNQSLRAEAGVSVEAHRRERDPREQKFTKDLETATQTLYDARNGIHNHLSRFRSFNYSLDPDAPNVIRLTRAVTVREVASAFFDTAAEDVTQAELDLLQVQNPDHAEELQSPDTLLPVGTELSGITLSLGVAVEEANNDIKLTVLRRVVSNAEEAPGELSEEKLNETRLAIREGEEQREIQRVLHAEVNAVESIGAARREVRAAIEKGDAEAIVAGYQGRIATAAHLNKGFLAETAQRSLEMALIRDLSRAAEYQKAQGVTRIAAACYEKGCSVLAAQLTDPNLPPEIAQQAWLRLHILTQSKADVMTQDPALQALAHYKEETGSEEQLKIHKAQLAQYVAEVGRDTDRLKASAQLLVTHEIFDGPQVERMLNGMRAGLIANLYEQAGQHSEEIESRTQQIAQLLGVEGDVLQAKETRNLDDDNDELNELQSTLLPDTQIGFLNDAQVEKISQKFTELSAVERARILPALSKLAERAAAAKSITDVQIARQTLGCLTTVAMREAATATDPAVKAFAQETVVRAALIEGSYLFEVGAHSQALRAAEKAQALAADITDPARAKLYQTHALLNRAVMLSLSAMTTSGDREQALAALETIRVTEDTALKAQTPSLLNREQLGQLALLEYDTALKCNASEHAIAVAKGLAQDRELYSNSPEIESAIDAANNKEREGSFISVLQVGLAETQRSSTFEKVIYIGGGGVVGLGTGTGYGAAVGGIPGAIVGAGGGLFTGMTAGAGVLVIKNLVVGRHAILQAFNTGLNDIDLRQSLQQSLALGMDVLPAIGAIKGIKAVRALKIEGVVEARGVQQLAKIQEYTRVASHFGNRSMLTLTGASIALPLATQLYDIGTKNLSYEEKRQALKQGAIDAARGAVMVGASMGAGFIVSKALQKPLQAVDQVTARIRNGLTSKLENGLGHLSQKLEVDVAPLRETPSSVLNRAGPETTPSQIRLGDASVTRVKISSADFEMPLTQAAPPSGMEAAAKARGQRLDSGSAPAVGDDWLKNNAVLTEEQYAALQARRQHEAGPVTPGNRAAWLDELPVLQSHPTDEITALRNIQKGTGTAPTSPHTNPVTELPDSFKPLTDSTRTGDRGGNVPRSSSSYPRTTSDAPTISPSNSSVGPLRDSGSASTGNRNTPQAAHQDFSGQITSADFERPRNAPAPIRPTADHTPQAHAGMQRAQETDSALAVLDAPLQKPAAIDWDAAFKNIEEPSNATKAVPVENARTQNRNNQLEDSATQTWDRDSALLRRYDRQELAPPPTPVVTPFPNPQLTPRPQEVPAVRPVETPHLNRKIEMEPISTLGFAHVSVQPQFQNGMSPVLSPAQPEMRLDGRLKPQTKTQTKTREEQQEQYGSRGGISPLDEHDEKKKLMESGENLLDFDAEDTRIGPALKRVRRRVHDVIAEIRAVFRRGSKHETASGQNFFTRPARTETRSTATGTTGNSSSDNSKAELVVETEVTLVRDLKALDSFKY
jgi:hypothetical protein